MHALKFIWNNLDRFRTRFGFIFFIGILDGFATFFIPVLLAEFTKSDFTALQFQKLLWWMLACYLASLVFQWVMRKEGESIGPEFSNHIRLKYFRALQRLSLADLGEHHSGYILSLINKVADALPGIIFDLFWSFAKGTANIGLFFFFVARESPAIAFLNLIILGVFIAASTFLSRRMVPLADALNTSKATLLERYADFMSNIATIKKLGVHVFARKKLDAETANVSLRIRALQSFHANRWFLLHLLFAAAFLSTIGFLLSQIARA
ncbi:ABC transporter ATP-binding protein, partial [Candidatus Azambacteria bacterium]|nr:ABC transporter ATP-binding protein [Candidatus Azambacteria bacterium]